MTLGEAIELFIDLGGLQLCKHRPVNLQPALEGLFILINASVETNKTDPFVVVGLSNTQPQSPIKYIYLIYGDLTICVHLGGHRQ